MNKFFKYGLITAGISMAAGIVFLLIGIAAGGKVFINNPGWVLNGMSRLGILDELDDWQEAHHGTHHGVNWSWGGSNNQLIINGEIQESISVPGEISAAGIRKLELYLGAGEFYVQEKDTDDGIISITVQGAGGCDYYTDGDTLYVETFKGNQFGNDFIGTGNQAVISFPKGSFFDEVELTCGAGVAEIYNLTAGELEIETGAGEVKVNSSAISKFSANVGAGRVEAGNMTAKEVDLEAGMGECVYQGKGLIDMEAECDLGNMKIIVDGSKEDYNYEIECSVGNIDIGGDRITGMGTERKINNGAQRNFELSCNMGNITVDFQN